MTSTAKMTDGMEEAAKAAAEFEKVSSQRSTVVDQSNPEHERSAPSQNEQAEHTR